MSASKQNIKSRLFGPHTKAMNASEYELVSSLLQYNTIVLPLFNVYELNDCLVSLEQANITTNTKIDESLRDGYIIPFDLVALPLPRKGYSALRHVARPDFFFVKDNVVKPIDIKHSVQSEDNLRQISADTAAHIFSHNNYFPKALQAINTATHSSLDDLVFEDGFSLSMIAARQDYSLLNILDRDDLVSITGAADCFSDDAEEMFNHFLKEGIAIKYDNKFSSRQVLEDIGDVHTAIYHLGAAPSSVLVVDGLDDHLRPLFRFSYLRDKLSPVSVFPIDIVLAEQVRDKYVNTFYDNPKEIDVALEKLFLPARIDHKMHALKESIARDKHRLKAVNNMISLTNHSYKTERRQQNNSDALLKINKLQKEIEVKEGELLKVKTTYHTSVLELEKQKELYAKHNKLGWEKYFGPVFDASMKRFDEEICLRKRKFNERTESAIILNKMFSEYTNDQPFLLHRSPHLAKLYMSIDKGVSYHAFSLSEKRLLFT